MTSKPMFKPSDRDHFDDQVIAAIQATTIEERFRIAHDWCLGERESYIGFAAARKLVPVALLVAALVDVEHPLLVDERGYLRQGSLLGCSVRLMQAFLRSEIVHIPCGQNGVIHRLEEQVPIKWELPTTIERLFRPVHRQDVENSDE